MNNPSRTSPPALAALLREPPATTERTQRAYATDELQARCVRHARWLGLPESRAQAVWQAAWRRAALNPPMATLDARQRLAVLRQWCMVLDRSLAESGLVPVMPYRQSRLAFLRAVLGLSLEEIAECLQWPLRDVAACWRDAAQALAQRAVAVGCEAEHSLAWFRGVHAAVARGHGGKPVKAAGRAAARWLMLVLLGAVLGLAMCDHCLRSVREWFAAPLAEGVLPDEPSGGRRLDEEVPLSSGDFLLFADGVEFATLERLDWLLWRQSTVLTQTIAEATPASALHTTTDAAWDALPDGMRASLSNWASDWGTLAAAQREMLVRHSARWGELNPAGQADTLRRAAAWGEIDPLRRAQLRERFVIWQGLGHAQQQLLLAEQDRLATLPPEQRAALAAEFERLSPAERRALLVRDAAGIATSAEAAFGFVPEGDRDVTLQMLGEWSAADRDLLVRVTQRLDTQGREQLRQRLLSENAAQRTTLLRAAASEVGVQP